MVEELVEVVQKAWEHVIVVLMQYKERENLVDETEMLHAYYPNNWFQIIHLLIQNDFMIGQF